jgi:hypothetical protein
MRLLPGPVNARELEEALTTVVGDELPALVVAARVVVVVDETVVVVAGVVVVVVVVDAVVEVVDGVE